jgi:hypothetical protein
MASSKSRSKSLFLEQLEDRLTLSVVNPQIEFVNGNNGPNSTAVNTLEVMNADGTNQTALVSMAGLRTPHWSPNLLGNSATAYEGALAFNTRYNASNGLVDQLWVTTVTVSNGAAQASSPLLLEDTNDPAVQNYLGNVVPTWSPNENPSGSYSGWIAFGVGTAINVTAVQFNGTTVTGLLDQSSVLWSGVPVAGGQIGGPAWSSDGNWLAFFAQRVSSTTPWQASLWMIPITWTNGVPSVAPGTTAINVIPEGSFAWISDMDWSRGGSTIAFRGSQNGSQGSPGNLYTVDVSSLQTNPSGPPPAFKQISAAYSSTSPSWSPDNSALVFSGQDLVHNKLTPANIRQVTLATGQQTILATANSNLVWPNWRATSLPYNTSNSGSVTASGQVASVTRDVRTDSQSMMGVAIDSSHGSNLDLFLTPGIFSRAQPATSNRLNEPQTSLSNLGMPVGSITTLSIVNAFEENSLTLAFGWLWSDQSPDGLAADFIGDLASEITAMNLAVTLVQ